MSSADISNFSPETNNLCFIQKYKYRLHFIAYFVIVLTFLESLMVALIIMVSILMMSAKLATLGPIKKGILK